MLLLTEVSNYPFIALLDVYLLGTVMLVFGMGLYELFVSNLDIAKSLSEENVHHRSNLFGLFTLKVSLSIYTFLYSIKPF